MVIAGQARHLPPGVVFDTTSEGPHSLFVPIVTTNRDKMYLTVVTFLFLLLFNEKRDSSFPSGLWIGLPVVIPLIALT